MKISFNLIVTGVIVAVLIGGAYAVNMAFASPGLQAATGTPGVTTTSTGTVQPTAVTATPKPLSLVRVWNNMCVQGVPYALLSVPPEAKFALVLPESQIVAAAGLPGPNTPNAPAGTAQAGAGTATPQASAGTSTPQASAGTATPQASTGGGTPQAAITSVPVTGGFGQVPPINSCTGLGTLNGQQLVMCTGPQGSRYTLYVHDAQGTQTYMGTLWDCTPHALPNPNKGAAPAIVVSPSATLPVPPQPSATATP